MTDRDFVTGTFILVANCFVTPLGILFATIWTSSKTWEFSNSPGGTSANDVSGSIGRYRTRTEVRSHTTYALEELPRSDETSNKDWKPDDRFGGESGDHKGKASIQASYMGSARSFNV